MKLQRDTYSCGVFAIQNSLKALGFKVSEKKIRQHSSTTRKDGTTQYGILNALERLGANSLEFRAESEDEAWERVADCLAEDGCPSIIEVYKGQHWVVLVGCIGDRILVFDSDNDKKNKQENGLHVLTKEQLFKLWKPSIEDNKHYGITVYKE